MPWNLKPHPGVLGSKFDWIVDTDVVFNKYFHCKPLQIFFPGSSLIKYFLFQTSSRRCGVWGRTWRTPPSSTTTPTSAPCPIMARPPWSAPTCQLSVEATWPRELTSLMEEVSSLHPSQPLNLHSWTHLQDCLSLSLPGLHPQSARGAGKGPLLRRWGGPSWLRSVTLPDSRDLSLKTPWSRPYKQDSITNITRSVTLSSFHSHMFLRGGLWFQWSWRAKRVFKCDLISRLVGLELAWTPFKEDSQSYWPQAEIELRSGNKQLK